MVVKRLEDKYETESGDAYDEEPMIAGKDAQGCPQRTRQVPAHCVPNFSNVRYKDGHIFLQVSDIKDIKLPGIPR